MFKHAVYTGFIDDAIRHEILPTLEEKDVTDEKLIEALNKNIPHRKGEESQVGKRCNTSTSVKCGCCNR